MSMASLWSHERVISAEIEHTSPELRQESDMALEWRADMSIDTPEREAARSVT